MLTDRLLKRIDRAARQARGPSADVDDLYQTGCLAVLEHLRDHEGEPPSEDLLATIAWRRMRSLIRSEKRHAGRVEGFELFDVFPDDAQADVDARLDAAEALDKLDATKRRWIEARLREGLSIKELAPRFGIAHATGQTWNHKIYKALRPGLESGYGAAENRERSKREENRVDERSNRHLLARTVHRKPEF